MTVSKSWVRENTNAENICDSPWLAYVVGLDKMSQHLIEDDGITYP